MSKRGSREVWSSGANWRSAHDYRALLRADRRAFAWEWIRRHPPYRAAWRERHRPPTAFGLLAYEDPHRATPDARPIWSADTDPRVLGSNPLAKRGQDTDLFDVRLVASKVSIAIEDNVEHWLISDGLWMVRLDLLDGTLLGGPTLLEHRLVGFDSAEAKISVLRQLSALAHRGDLPPSLRPREIRAPRWVLELRAADALAVGASQQEMARCFFGTMVVGKNWRVENASYRLRIRRLVRLARKYLDDPFQGPWFR
jgi:hypothetical protein